MAYDGAIIFISKIIYFFNFLFDTKDGLEEDRKMDERENDNFHPSSRMLDKTWK